MKYYTHLDKIHWLNKASNIKMIFKTNQLEHGYTWKIDQRKFHHKESNISTFCVSIDLKEKQIWHNALPFILLHVQD